jgi:hypothetical protein
MSPYSLRFKISHAHYRNHSQGIGKNIIQEVKHKIYLWFQFVTINGDPIFQESVRVKFHLFHHFLTEPDLFKIKSLFVSSSDRPDCLHSIFNSHT